MDNPKKNALSIFKAGVAAAGPRALIRTKVSLNGSALDAGEELCNLNDYDDIYVVGGGKAAPAMAASLEEILLDRITSGIVVTSRGSGRSSERVKIVEAGHPVPDESGAAGASEIIRLLEHAGERTLVLCVISGGASALLSAPAPPVSLQDKQHLTAELLACGAAIREINTVRKHVSRIKGGRLALAAHPARIITLILSDVVGDPPDAIASGPTAPDPTTFRDALNILEKYGLTGKIPDSVIQYITRGVNGEITETPKSGDPVFARVSNMIIGSNRDALGGAAQHAAELGYNVHVLSDTVTGESRDAVHSHVEAARNIVESGIPVQRPACLLSGGETTVTIRGKGKGGRNQEFALASALAIEGMPGITVLSSGTDGIDGPTDAAGAIVDGDTCRRAVAVGLDPCKYLDNNDSYTFFKALGDLVITGPTGTNVMDLQIVLIEKSD